MKKHYWMITILFAGIIFLSATTPFAGKAPVEHKRFSFDYDIYESINQLSKEDAALLTETTCNSGKNAMNVAESKKETLACPPGSKLISNRSNK
jgi:hypothetical protein